MEAPADVWSVFLFSGESLVVTALCERLREQRARATAMADAFRREEEVRRDSELAARRMESGLSALDRLGAALGAELSPRRSQCSRHRSQRLCCGASVAALSFERRAERVIASARPSAPRTRRRSSRRGWGARERGRPPDRCCASTMCATTPDSRACPPAATRSAACCWRGSRGGPAVGCSSLANARPGRVRRPSPATAPRVGRAGSGGDRERSPPHRRAAGPGRRPGCRAHEGRVPLDAVPRAANAAQRDHGLGAPAAGWQARCRRQAAGHRDDRAQRQPAGGV